MKGREIVNQIAQKEMPDIEQVRTRCVMQAVPQKSPRSRMLVVSTVLASLLVTAALAAATDGFKFLFGSFTSRADMTTRNEESGFVKDYRLGFSHLDEIRDLFNINLGNAYMDTVQKGHEGELYVSERDSGTNVRITSRFTVGGCSLNAEVWVPLEADETWDVAYTDYHAADSEVRYLYEGKNGITARVVLDQRSLPDWTLDLRFVYDGAYYIIQSDNVMQTFDGQIDVEKTVAAFIEAFDKIN